MIIEPADKNNNALKQAWFRTKYITPIENIEAITIWLFISLRIRDDCWIARAFGLDVYDNRIPENGINAKKSFRIWTCSRV